MLATVVGFGRDVHHEGYAPEIYVAILCALLAVFVTLAWLGPQLRRSTRTTLRTAATFVGLPTVFSSLCYVLPMLHPEPYEWTWIAVDRAMFGVDPTVVLQALLSPWFVEILQWCYGVFYFVPIAVLTAILFRRDGATFDRALCAVVFGFLASYLGYVLFPTLPPYRFLTHDVPLQGVFAAEWIHGVLDRAEVNRFDCFPSGHTMMSLVALHLGYRHVPRLAVVLTPIVLLLILATLALRYHYAIDVLVGAVLAPISLSCSDWLCRRFERGAITASHLRS